jgi:hypothetical protein
MPKVKLTAEVDPELERRLKIAATGADKSVSEWIEELVQRELENGVPAKSVGMARNSLPPEFHIPPAGVRPTRYRNPVKLRPGSGTVADAVLEDRGER